jgi:hypothetical protein
MLQALLDDSLVEKVKDGNHKQLADYFDNTNYEQHATRTLPDTATAHVNQWVKRQQGQFAPSFYVRILADARGLSPTPRQLRRVIGRMCQYISGDLGYVEQCVAIDNTSRSNRSDHAHIEEKQHFFLDGSMERVQVIITFCEAL